MALLARLKRSSPASAWWSGWSGSPATWARLMDNPFSNILAGSVGFFVKAGLLGGGGALLGLMGLVGGATL